MLERLAEHNPSVFKGAFQTKFICVYARNSPVVNATAYLGQDKILFNSQTILAAKNDAQIAATMAHEAAHLTMQSEHMDWPSALLAHPDWISTRVAADNKLASIRAEAHELQSKLDAERSRLDLIEYKIVERLDPENAKKHVALARERRRVLAKFDTFAVDIPVEDIYSLRDSIRPFPLTNIFDVGIYSADLPEAEALPYPDAETARAEIEKLNRDLDAFLIVMRTKAEKLVSSWEVIVTAIADLQKQLEPMDEKKRAVEDEVNRFIEKVLGENVRFNWREQEAGEVGFEMFLRAKFLPEEMVWIKALYLGKEKYASCLENHVKTGVVPARGGASNPSHCWRIFDILYLEPTVHKADYELLIKEATVTNFLGNELSEIQESLKAKLRENK